MRIGPAGAAKELLKQSHRAFHRWRTRDGRDYRAPTQEELRVIEQGLHALGVPCHDLILDTAEFADFAQHAGFAADYHGGIAGGVYQEKLLEHFVAWNLLRLDTQDASPYIDVAACASPWATLLRNKGVEAYAIDLAVPDEFSALDYYRQEDATRTSFADASIRSASLQCAFEMFVGPDDMGLIREFGRILMPGGRAVISPLYMHTHPCYYQTQDHYGEPHGDADAVGYVRRDVWGVPASRKYSPETLQSRVLDSARRAGLDASLLVLRNAKDIAEGIYMHFILVLDKPQQMASQATGRQP
jgi:hypothetical protein